MGKGKRASTPGQHGTRVGTPGQSAKRVITTIKKKTKLGHDDHEPQPEYGTALSVDFPVTYDDGSSGWRPYFGEITNINSGKIQVSYDNGQVMEHRYPAKITEGEIVLLSDMFTMDDYANNGQPVLGMRVVFDGKKRSFGTITYVKETDEGAYYIVITYDAEEGEEEEEENMTYNHNHQSNLKLIGSRTMERQQFGKDDEDEESSWSNGDDKLGGKDESKENKPKANTNSNKKNKTNNGKPKAKAKPNKKLGVDDVYNKKKMMQELQGKKIPPSLSSVAEAMISMKAVVAGSIVKVMKEKAKNSPEFAVAINEESGLKHHYQVFESKFYEGKGDIALKEIYDDAESYATKKLVGHILEKSNNFLQDMSVAIGVPNPGKFILKEEYDANIEKLQHEIAMLKEQLHGVSISHGNSESGNKADEESLARAKQITNNLKSSTQVEEKEEDAESERKEEEVEEQKKKETENEKEKK